MGSVWLQDAPNMIRRRIWMFWAEMRLGKVSMNSAMIVVSYELRQLF